MWTIQCFDGPTDIPTLKPTSSSSLIPLAPTVCLSVWSTPTIPLRTRGILVRTTCFQVVKPTESSLDSAADQPISRFEWSLHVTCEFIRSHQPLSCQCMTQPSIPTPSWEYFTSIEYEWSVIRGHRPYRWTIWVRRYIYLTLVLPLHRDPG